MARRGTPLIAVTTHSPMSAYPLLQGVGDYAQRYGPWRFEMLSVQSPDFAQQFKQGAFDGLICHLTHLPRLAGAVSRLRRRAVGLIEIDEKVAIPVVAHDDVAVGRLGAEHLMELRLEGYAFVGVDAPWSRKREAGFTAAVRAAGRPVAEGFWQAGSSPEAVQVDRLRRWLKPMARPLGVMGCNDIAAATVLQACSQLDLRVPEDVAILGVDNNPARCEFAPTPLSSIELDFHQIGYAAALLLDRLMRGERVGAEPVLVPPIRVVTRRGTSMTLFADTDIHRAVQYIRDHAHDGIGVLDVVRDVNISRRTLERRFATVVGRTPDAEIRRVRLETARGLLVKTNVPLSDIAARCGFSSLTYMGKAFRAAYNTTPRAYRLAHGGGRP